jgi:hypothetical protein
VQARRTIKRNDDENVNLSDSDLSVDLNAENNKNNLKLVNQKSRFDTDHRK